MASSLIIATIISPTTHIAQSQNSSLTHLAKMAPTRRKAFMRIVVKDPLEMKVCFLKVKKMALSSSIRALVSRKGL